MTNNSEEQIYSLPHRAEDLMPHSSSMCVIDELVAVHEDFAEATVEIKSNSPFMRKDGTLEECVFIEMIAQSIAARSGFDLTAEKLKTQKGFLLGVKGVQITGSARAGDLLRIKVSKTGQYGDFSIIEGVVFKQDQIIAQGEIKVIQITEADSAESMS